MNTIKVPASCFTEQGLLRIRHDPSSDQHFTTAEGLMPTIDTRWDFTQHSIDEDPFVRSCRAAADKLLPSK